MQIFAINDRNDFLEFISTWNSIYESNHINYDVQSKATPVFMWKKGLLKVASSICVIDECKGTPVELMLNKVISYSKMLDESKIQEVHEILHTVENYLNEEMQYS
jgi:hypothetical protein